MPRFDFFVWDASDKERLASGATCRTPGVWDAARANPGLSLNKRVDSGLQALLTKGSKDLRTAATEALRNELTRDGSGSERRVY